MTMMLKVIKSFAIELILFHVPMILEGTKDTCAPLPMDDPDTRIQVASVGKNASDPFSVGVVLNITCSEGHRLNVGNRTVKCNKRGSWKPDRPVCLLSKS